MSVKCLLACARVGVCMPLSMTVVSVVRSPSPCLSARREATRWGSTYTKKNVYWYVLFFLFHIGLVFFLFAGLLLCACACLRTRLLSLRFPPALCFDFVFLFFCPFPPPRSPSSSVVLPFYGNTHKYSRHDASLLFVFAARLCVSLLALWSVE